VVGYNMAAYRKAAGITQEELGKRLGGWTKVAVSAAERSWDGKRIRKFDADELVAIGVALGVPMVALMLPPENSGTSVRYVLDAQPDKQIQDLTGLLPYLAPTRGDDSPAMTAYRNRLMALGLSTDDRDEADQVLADALTRAQALELDAQERHKYAMKDLIQQRYELERRVDDLRAFEREYRSRLRAYLVGQLGDLDKGAATDSGVFPAMGSGPSA
jgi:transcriptional regulator with XRE-family HTH domain